MPDWTLRPQIHEKLRFLLSENWRYKCAHGGRGGGKSFSFADAALARLISERITVTVCRELDTTIRDSVHKLIKERIEFHGLGKACKITDNEIRFNNGSLLNYKHLRNNVTEVKGLQSTKICWIFEAESVTKESWEVLDPTIRIPGSEVWIEFNPDNNDDFIYDRFVVNKPDNAKVVEINYHENPLCPKELIDQAEECKRNRPDDYLHIWLGKPSNVGSKIYPTFDDQLHVRDCDLNRFKSTGNFFMGQDPATVYYPFAVWMIRVPKGEKEFDYIVYNEFPTVGMMGGKFFHEIRNEKICSLTLKQRANMFRVLDNTIDQSHNWIEILGRGIDTRFVKASGAASTTLNTRGLIQTMSDTENGGLTFITPPEGMIDVQRDNIRTLLDYNKDLGIVFGFNEPHFYVMPHCYNVIDAFKNHRVDKTKKVEDPKRKDPIDAVRITMAMMESIPHKIKDEMKKEVMPEVNAIDEMRNIWMNNR